MDIKFQLGTHHGKQHPTVERLYYVDVDLVNGDRSSEAYPGSFSGYVVPEVSVLLLAAPGQSARIAMLQSALSRLLKDIDDEMGNREGVSVLPPDSGCIECTLGTVPNDKNTGLCAYHAAHRALIHIA